MIWRSGDVEIECREERLITSLCWVIATQTPMKHATGFPCVGDKVGHQASSANMQAVSCPHQSCFLLQQVLRMMASLLKGKTCCDSWRPAGPTATSDPHLVGRMCSGKTFILRGESRVRTPVCPNC